MSYLDEGYNFLLGIDYTLDDQDGINSRNVDEIMESGAVTFDYTNMNVLAPNQDMQSENFVTGVQGWKIYGDGYAEFAGITLTGGLLHYNKTSFTDSVNSGYYISPEGIYFGSAGDATKLKFKISDGSFEYIGKLSGRESSTIAAAIDINGNLVKDVINAKLDTQTKEILGSFTFGASGAIRMNTDLSNGLWISPTGILGKKAGVTTFAITTSGDASFAGELIAAFGTFGTITAGTIIGTTLIGGRLATTIGGSIDVNGNFIKELLTTTFNTQTNRIMGEFTFTGVGAIKIATDASNGIWLSPTGILGKKAGVTTFAVDVLGNASFGGTLIAASGTFGTITAGTFTGVTITGATIQTAASPNDRLVINTSNLTGYDNPAIKRMQLDRDYLEFYDTSAQRTTTFDADGMSIWQPGSTTVKRLDLWTDGSYTYIDGGYSLYGIVIRSLRDVTTPPIAIFYHDGTVSRLIMQGTSQRIESNRITVDTHINFGVSTSGDSGYGIRQSAGVMQVKNSGGAWVNIPTATGEANTASSAGGSYGLYYTKSGVDLQFKGLSAGTGISIANNGTYLTITNTGSSLPAGVTLNMMYYDGFNWGATSTVYVGGLTGGTLSWSSSMFQFNSSLQTTGDLRANGNVVFQDTNGRIIFNYTGTQYSYGPYQLNYKDHAGTNQTKYVLAQLSP